MRTAIKRTALTAAILLAAAAALFCQQNQSPASNSPLAKTAREKQILAELDRVAKGHETYLSVSVEDGEALWLLTEAAGARRVAEIRPA